MSPAFLLMTKCRTCFFVIFVANDYQWHVIKLTLENNSGTTRFFLQNFFNEEFRENLCAVFTEKKQSLLVCAVLFDVNYRVTRSEPGITTFNLHIFTSNVWGQDKLRCMPLHKRYSSSQQD
jgi:hypothetical protein